MALTAAGSAAAGEAEITAVCELALLHRRLQHAAYRPPRCAALADILPLWLQSQAASPAVARLVAHGPALALTAPLMLDATLGAASPVDRTALLAAVERFDPARATPVFWRQRELADLIACCGGRAMPPRARPAVPRLAAQQAASIDDAYCFTHEVFHHTNFGARAGEAAWRAAALSFLQATMAAIVAVGHLDLIGEYWAVARCLGVDPPVAQGPLYDALAPLRAPWRSDCRALPLYHPRLVVVLALLCGGD